MIVGFKVLSFDNPESQMAINVFGCTCSIVHINHLRYSSDATPKMSVISSIGKRRLAILVATFMLSLSVVVAVPRVAAQVADPTTIFFTCPPLAGGPQPPVGSSVDCTAAVTDQAPSPTTPTGTVLWSWQPSGALTPNSPNPCTLMPISDSASACTTHFIW